MSTQSQCLPPGDLADLETWQLQSKATLNTPLGLKIADIEAQADPQAWLLIFGQLVGWD